MRKNSLGPAAGLTIVALAVLSGCQPKGSAVTRSGSSSEQTPVSSEQGSGSSTDVQPTGTGPTPSSSETPTGASPTPGTATTTPGAGDTPVTNTPTANSSTGPVTLRFAFAKGAQMKYKSVSESTTSMSGSDAKMPAMKPMTTSSDTMVKVVDNTGGKAKIELSVGSMDMKGGMTDPNAQKQMQKMAQDVTGLKVSASFDAMGNPSNQQFIKGDKMQAMAVGIDSSTGFLGITYPEKAVNPGDTWTHDVDYKSVIGAMGPMANATWTNSKVTTKFTLKSIDTTKGIAIVLISASGSPSVSMKLGDTPKGGDKAGKMPSEMKMTFKINGSGTATIDLKTGLPSEIVYENSTEFSNPMGGGTMTKKDKATLKKV